MLTIFKRLNYNRYNLLFNKKSGGDTLQNAPPRSVGLEIKHLANIIKRHFDAKLTERTFNEKEFSNITITQSHVIGFIYHHDNYEVFQNDLEKEFYCRRSTITGILQSMEKNDLISRTYSKKDARVKIVKLTDKAISIHEKLMEQIDMFNMELESCLTNDEISNFYSMAKKIKNHLNTN